MSASSHVPPPPITSALAPDLDAVKKFIEEMVAKGAVVALVSAILALLVRLRDLNTELMAKLASKSRKRPPNEAMRRLQMELPFLCAPAAAAHDAIGLEGALRSIRRRVRAVYRALLAAATLLPERKAPCTIRNGNFTACTSRDERRPVDREPSGMHIWGG